MFIGHGLLGAPLLGTCGELMVVLALCSKSSIVFSQITTLFMQFLPGTTPVSFKFRVVLVC